MCLNRLVIQHDKGITNYANAPVSHMELCYIDRSFQPSQTAGQQDKSAV
jgi:hypothetical protein